METDVIIGLPPVQDLRKRMAQAEAQKITENLRRHAQEESEKKALIEHMQKPSGVSDQAAIRRAVVLIERAVGNGLNEVQVYRFPNALCTDHGRAINQQEPGWEETLTGTPREIYELWARQFRPRGYKLRVQIIDFPHDMPGDIAMTLAW
jgi:hypothetical protein